MAQTQGWPAALCEGSFYQTDDGVLHMLLRNTARGNDCRLWLTESRDNGATWSTPVETDFSDTNAKFHFGRLPDGRFYYVGNPVGGGRTPLVLSLSRDGVRFDQHFILGDTHYERRRPGRRQRRRIRLSPQHHPRRPSLRDRLAPEGSGGSAACRVERPLKDTHPCPKP